MSMSVVLSIRVRPRPPSLFPPRSRARFRSAADILNTD